MNASLGTTGASDGYLHGRGHAWFAFAMTFALMLSDYVDRQIIVSLFPYIKADWGVSDAQLGALVSVVSITVALGALPISLAADRFGRVRSIVVMAVVWSAASISAMFARNYAQLFAARALVGLGEAGYGSAGAAIVSTLFPLRLRASVLAAFFAAASIGSVLGVLAGGLLATEFGWQAAFGVVGVPGLLLALVYSRVKDYQTVRVADGDDQAAAMGDAARRVWHAFTRTPSLLRVCVGASAQLVVVSGVWAWLPSYLNRFHGVAPDMAAVQASLVVLCGAAGGVLWGRVVDRAGRRGARRKLTTLTLLTSACAVALSATFGLAGGTGLELPLVFLSGALLTCTVGPVAAIVIDVVHPGVRATGAAVLSLFQNLFGLAVGPLLLGAMSDHVGLDLALSIVPLAGLLAAWMFLSASRVYEADLARVRSLEPAADVSDGRGAAIAR